MSVKAGEEGKKSLLRRRFGWLADDDKTKGNKPESSTGNGCIKDMLGTRNIRERKSAY